MINTVTGAVDKKGFKKACIHEHVSIVSNDMLNTFGKEWFDKKKFIPLAVEVLKKSGFDMFVDGTPCDLGRDVRLLKAVSKKSGVKIVASTGFYYLPNIYSDCRTANDLIDWILKECEVGMEGTNIKPGILKCASHESKLNSHTEKRLQTMAVVQNKTGLPMYVHCSHNNEVEEKLEFLIKNGANPERLIIGHCALKPNANYLENIIKSGCYIAMDQNHCTPHKEQAIEVLNALCARGYSNKILLSSDYCIYSDFGKPGWLGNEHDSDYNVYKLNYQEKVIKPKFTGKIEDFERMMGENILEVLDV